VTDNGAAAVKLFREELALCGVAEGQTVAVVTPQGRFHERAEGFLDAACSLGALAYALTIPPVAGIRGTVGIGQTSLSGQRQLVELLKAADLVVDLAFMHFSREQNELLASDVRILACVEPLPVLQRLFPSVDLRRRVEEAAGWIARASELHVVSEWGTDVTYELDGRLGVLAEYGFTETPGRWDHWPAGFVATHAAVGGVHGTVALKPNDVLLLPVPQVVRDPVRLAIKDGYIVSIEGDGLDAMVLRDFFPDPADDPEALAVSHIGWGLNRDARWELFPDPSALQMDLRAFYGSVLFSTGPDTDMGGTRETLYHLDVPLRDCSLYLDGEPVVEAGRLTAGAGA
jgi:2,5-dihydroxypyridine 5,6-dioxygenase